MTWQPVAVEYPDAEAVVVDLLTTLLADAESSSSSPSDDLWIGRTLPNPRPPRAVQVVRDGGAITGMRDQARLRVLVWDRRDETVNDLARRIVAVAPLMAGQDGVLRVQHLSGPVEIPDAAPKRYLLFQVDLRGEQL